MATKSQPQIAAAHQFPDVPTIPQTGFVRLPQILAVYPVGRSTWWAGVKCGKYPAAVKLSEHITAWRAEDIRSLLKSV